MTTKVNSGYSHHVHERPRQLVVSCLLLDLGSPERADYATHDARQLPIRVDSVQWGLVTVLVDQACLKYALRGSGQD